MVEIVYYAAASLDGFIATPDGGVDWLPPIEAGGEDYGYGDFYPSVDAILMGSATYENILRHAAWPYPDKRCWVFSKQRRYAKSSTANIAANRLDRCSPNVVLPCVPALPRREATHPRRALRCPAGGCSDAWELGDGRTSIQASPVARYSSDGAYAVKYRTTDSAGCEATRRRRRCASPR